MRKPCTEITQSSEQLKRRAKRKGVSGKQMGSTVCGVPGICRFARGSSERSYSGTKGRGKTPKPINIQKSRRDKCIDLNDHW